MTAIKKLFRILTTKDRKDIILLLTMGVLYAGFQALSVASIFPFINLVMNPQLISDSGLLSNVYELFKFNNEKEYVVFLGFVVLIIITISSILGILTSWLKSRFVQYKGHYLSKRLLKLYMYKPYSFFLNRNSSELSKNILSEINELSNQYILALIDVVINTMILVILIITLLIINVTATLYIFILLFGTYGFVNIYSRRRLKRLGMARVENNRLRFKLVNEAFSSIKITKVMANEDYFIKKYHDFSYRMANTKIIADVIRELPNHVLDLIAFGGIVGFIIYKIMINDSIQLIIPIISVFALAGYRMKPAINKLYASITNIHYNQAVLDRIYDDMIDEDANINNEHGVGLAKPILFKYSITLNDISFHYKNSNKLILNKINLTINKNDMIGIMGITGSGKTTLVDLIMGLHTPTSGKIEVDDVILDKELVSVWQKRIGYVPQDIILSDDTIISNIAFGLDEVDIDLDKVKMAAKIAALDDFVEALADKYQTIIGERGVRISGGQRQRIGIARALYRDCDILILDEATSSLDNDTEKEVLEAIANAAVMRTVIMIAHRISTLRDCNIIYKIEDGSIVGKGSYNEFKNS